MSYYRIDRFEGGYAVCERPDGKMEDVPRDQLPPDAAEGDLIGRENGAWRVDRQATEERRAAMREKRARLFKRRGG